MEEKKVYESIEADETLVCWRCQEPLVKGNAKFSYLGNAFPVELPMCPTCKLIYVPEELALGRVLKVEKEMEDK